VRRCTGPGPLVYWHQRQKISSDPWLEMRTSKHLIQGYDIDIFLHAPHGDEVRRVSPKDLWQAMSRRVVVMEMPTWLHFSLCVLVHLIRRYRTSFCTSSRRRPGIYSVKNRRSTKILRGSRTLKEKESGGTIWPGMGAARSARQTAPGQVNFAETDGGRRPKKKQRGE
jgi:hypothetical protein